MKRASRPRWTTLELPVQLGWPLRKSKPKRLLHRLQAYCRRWLPSTRPLRKVLTMQQKRQQCQKVTKLRFFNNSWSYRESHLQALTRQQGEFQLMQVYYQWFRLQVLLRLRHQVWRRASSCLSRHVSDQKKSSLHLSARLPAKARLPTWSNKHGAFLSSFMSVSGASIMGQYFLFSWAELQLGPNFYNIFSSRFPFSYWNPNVRIFDFLMGMCDFWCILYNYFNQDFWLQPNFYGIFPFGSTFMVFLAALPFWLLESKRAKYHICLRIFETFNEV